MANDKQKRAQEPARPAPVVTSEAADVAPVVVEVVEVVESVRAEQVTPATATHVTVKTRGQARVHRIGHVFTPREVDLEIAVAWPDPIVRADCLRSLVHEHRDGCLEVEFIKL